MVRKGRLQEVISKALYGDDSKRYTVSYRDFDFIVTISLLEFLKLSENFEVVPASRILTIERNGVTQYSKKTLQKSKSKTKKSRKQD